MPSNVSPICTTVCPQPAGIGHEFGGVAVIVDVGIILATGDSRMSGVALENKVAVAVSGSGEGGTRFVAVGVNSGTNSTSEMDNAPMINRIEISAIVSAFPISRNRIICSLDFSAFYPQVLRLQPQQVITR